MNTNDITRPCASGCWAGCASVGGRSPQEPANSTDSIDFEDLGPSTFWLVVPSRRDVRHGSSRADEAEDEAEASGCPLPSVDAAASDSSSSSFSFLSSCAIPTSRYPGFRSQRAVGVAHWHGYFENQFAQRGTGGTASRVGSLGIQCQSSPTIDLTCDGARAVQWARRNTKHKRTSLH
ncbi:hypothetical protein ANO11243_096040 [Dothideomycetidae sp. 11243]|nr:hypothetical protein ANO11243_096040 [fungal sp. No.11243]